MGARGDSGGGSGGNTGADAGFFISQDKKKSKLSKKNQDLVDASFKDRGGVKIDQAVKTPLIGAVAGPLKAGSKVTRNFFTDKVLGSKNYKGTSKEDFEKLTVSQQESMYESYLEGRQSGKTDAYGNPLSGGGGDNNQMSSTGTTTKTALLSSTPTSTEADEVITETASEKPKTEDERIIAAKRKNKTRTRLDQKDDELTLGKKVLLST